MRLSDALSTAVTRVAEAQDSVIEDSLDLVDVGAVRYALDRIITEFGINFLARNFRGYYVADTESRSLIGRAPLTTYELAVVLAHCASLVFPDPSTALAADFCRKVSVAHGIDAGIVDTVLEDILGVPAEPTDS